MKSSKKLVLFAAVAAVSLTVIPRVGQGVTIDVTQVRQRYPWNGLVDIDYTITRSGEEAALDPMKQSVEITVVNCENAVTNVAHVFRQGALPVADGTHRVTWDANAEGITFNSQSVKVFAEIVHYAEKYMVIDVSAGSGSTAVYPVTYLQGSPQGGFNKDEYKGSNIVLRLVPPGSFVMGSPTKEPGRNNSYVAKDSEVQHAVAITKPFYIGIFEITQKQYKYVMNATPSQATGDCRPVENVSYADIRGTVEGAKWPESGSVDASSFMGKLRAKCKEWDGEAYTKDVAGLFDLPTEAQWEYACRAGTTSPYNDGVDCATEDALATQLNGLGCYKRSTTDRHTDVGSYASNAWGLYDMHGNVWERCLDWYREDVQNIGNPSLDPVGADEGSYRVQRGGCWFDSARDCRSAARVDITPSGYLYGYAVTGFRLSMTLP